MKPGTPHLVIVNYTSPTNRTPVSSFDSSVANFRSCRNPEGRMAKPWCYVSAVSHTGNSMNLYLTTVGYRKAPCKVDMCGRSIGSLDAPHQSPTMATPSVILLSSTLCPYILTLQWFIRLEFGQPFASAFECLPAHTKFTRSQIKVQFLFSSRSAVLAKADVWWWWWCWSENILFTWLTEAVCLHCLHLVDASGCIQSFQNTADRLQESVREPNFFIRTKFYISPYWHFFRLWLGFWRWSV